MGRYYNGDIEGKFWFAVQSSTAADRFGKDHLSPGYVEYWYDGDDLLGVEAEIKKIKETIGEENLKKIDAFFNDVESYNDEIMKKHGLDVSVWDKHKSDYADLGLGMKIRDCLIEHNECSFTAEL